MTGDKVRVRVRGITATAVSKLLLDKGLRIVQASRIIQERLGVEFDPSPADVTVKDSGEDELLVLGFYGCGDKVYDVLVDELGEVFSWVSPIGLYSVHVGRVVEVHGNGLCIIELPGGYKGVLPRCTGLEPGRLVLVSVVHPALKPGETIRLFREVRVVGEYVSLIHGSTRLTVSEHIRDRERRDYLVALVASKLIGTGLGAHLRSSSKYAGDDEIVSEIDKLKEILVELVGKARNASEPVTLYEGEFIGLLGLTSTAKYRLDHYRSLVTPTIRGHHSFKSIGGPYGEVVDFAEKLLPRINNEQLSEALLDYVIEKMINYPVVRITHILPNGERTQLTPGVFKKFLNERGLLVIERVFKKPGVYDGLGLEKKPGDKDLLVVPLNDYWISHNYYRGREWLGSYININTPPEILPGTIKYHDLLVDVVVEPTGSSRIIDEEELEEYTSKNIIPEKLAEKASMKAEEINENPLNYTYQELLEETMDKE